VVVVEVSGHAVDGFVGALQAGGKQVWAVDTQVKGQALTSLLARVCSSAQVGDDHLWVLVAFGAFRAKLRDALHAEVDRVVRVIEILSALSSLESTVEEDQGNDCTTEGNDYTEHNSERLLALSRGRSDALWAVIALLAGAGRPSAALGRCGVALDESTRGQVNARCSTVGHALHIKYHLGSGRVAARLQKWFEEPTARERRLGVQGACVLEVFAVGMYGDGCVQVLVCEHAA